MRVPAWLRRRVLAVAARRPADVSIGGEQSPYLLRWHLVPRNRFFNVYLHRFLRSDDDRALHDHPWCNLSVVLLGVYVEHGPRGVPRWRLPGDLVFRLPRTPHRIALRSRESCWTLFLTGPRVREWGFHCPGGWRHWRDFTDETGARVGRGCD